VCSQRLIQDKKDVDGADCLEDPVREAKVQHYLSKLPHPNLCRLLGLFSDAQYLYIVMEFLHHGSLNTAPGPQRTEDVAREIFASCIRGACLDAWRVGVLACWRGP
jgi:serine/threonine protein kinase